MATDSSILAWEIPWTEEPGGLQFIALQKNQIRLSNYTTTKALRKFFRTQLNDPNSNRLLCGSATCYVMKVKEEREKVGLKLNIPKTKIMACGPVTLWQIGGETMETVTDFIFWGLQNHCRW